MTRLDAILKIARRFWPERSIHIVCGPKEVRGWHLAGQLPAIQLFDFTTQDIGGEDDTWDLQAMVDGELHFLYPDVRPPTPSLLPRCAAVNAARKIEGIDPRPTYQRFP